MISSEHLKRLSDLLIKYLEVRSELVMLQVKDYIAQIITNIVLLLLTMSFVLLIVLMACFGLSLYLNEIFHSSYLGFLVTIGVLSLLFLILYALRKSILKAIVFKTISNCFQTDANSKEND